MFQTAGWWGQSAGSAVSALIHNTCVDPIVRTQRINRRSAARPLGRLTISSPYVPVQIVNSGAIVFGGGCRYVILGKLACWYENQRSKPNRHFRFGDGASARNQGPGPLRNGQVQHGRRRRVQ